MEGTRYVDGLFRFNKYCGCADFAAAPLRSTSAPCVDTGEVFLDASLLFTDHWRRYITSIVPVDDIVSLFPSIFSETPATPMLGRFRGGLSEPRGDTIGGEVRSAPGVEPIRGAEFCVHCLGVWLPEALFEMGVSVWGLRGGLCSGGFAAGAPARERELGVGEPERTGGREAGLDGEGVGSEPWWSRGGCEDRAVRGTEGTGGGERTDIPCLALALCEICEDWAGCGGWTG